MKIRTTIFDLMLDYEAWVWGAAGSTENSTTGFKWSHLSTALLKEIYESSLLHPPFKTCSLDHEHGVPSSTAFWSKSSRVPLSTIVSGLLPTGWWPAIGLTNCHFRINCPDNNKSYCFYRMPSHQLWPIFCVIFIVLHFERTIEWN